MSEPLDPKVISKLAEILDKNNLTELEYEDEGCRICLTREIAGATVTYAQPNSLMQAPAAVSAPLSPAPAEVAPIAAETDYSKNPNTVKSPMVGVVYLSNDPNTPDYVKVGTTVKEGDTLCLIEAMKTYNPVKAPKAGQVTKILVTTGDPVEYGEPLVVIE